MYFAVRKQDDKSPIVLTVNGAGEVGLLNLESVDYARVGAADRRGADLEDHRRRLGRRQADRRGGDGGRVRLEDLRRHDAAEARRRRRVCTAPRRTTCSTTSGKRSPR